MADNNSYQQVELYLDSMLPLMENLDPFYKLANKMFDQFESNPYGYGKSVSFDKPVRTRISNGLVANFDSVSQPKVVLNVEKFKNGSYAVADENYYAFKQPEWKEKYGRSFVSEMGTIVGVDIASVAETSTYRTYGDGITSINSVKQVAEILANLRNYGASNTTATVILPDVKTPAIVNNGLEQFVSKRNDDFANSWELGSWANAKFYTSNLLPTHQAGTAGLNQDVLSIEGINAAGDQLTISGITTNINAFLQNDIITLDPTKSFTGTTSGGQGAKFLTYIGHGPCDQSVQVRVTNVSVNAIAGTATVNIYPALNSTIGSPEENVNFDITTINVGNPIAAKALQSHKCGLVYTSNPLYVATPKLPAMKPFDSVSKMSPTGISMRLSYGSLFGQGTMGWIHDMQYGFKLVDEYAMRIAFPVND